MTDMSKRRQQKQIKKLGGPSMLNNQEEKSLKSSNEKNCFASFIFDLKLK